MASSRYSSNGPDEVDITTFMVAFEAINKLKLSVELSVQNKGPVAEMIVQVTAWTLSDPSVGPPPSVLLSVRAGVAPHQTLQAAILQLLYVLDGRLDEREAASGARPKA